MTVQELLESIREPYVRRLAEFSYQQPAYIEPAFRLESGALATEGVYDLPCRADFIPKDSGPHKSFTVDSVTRVDFEAISIEVENVVVSFSPFVWDWAPIQVSGLLSSVAGPALRVWFLRWFDVEDQNEKTAEGLYGVAHFMSDPETNEQDVRVTVDLGSAPTQALEDLIFRMSDAGATGVRIG